MSEIMPTTFTLICTFISCILHTGALIPCQKSGVDGEECGDFQCCQTNSNCYECGLMQWCGGEWWDCKDQINPSGDMPPCTPLCDGISTTATCTKTSTLSDNYSGCEHPGKLITHYCDCYESVVPSNNCGTSLRCSSACDCALTCEWTNLFCPVISEEATAAVPGGEGFIQIGKEFRFGLFDIDHFSISSQTEQKTIIYFNENGIATAGPSNDYGLWNKPLLAESKNIRFTNRGI
eukprot:UN05896